MIKWISDRLGSSARDQVEATDDLRIIDVRDLVDKPGNLPQDVRNKIAEAAGYLESGKRVIVCCDYGISRSNAVAAGILSFHKKLPFAQAVREVMKATGEKEIKIEVLAVVREALGGTVSAAGKRSAVLVTGGSGFLGAALLAKLRTSHQVFNPSRAEVDLNEGAAELDLFVKEHDVGCIVHLANPHILNTNEAMGETLVLLKNVLDVCCHNQLRLIYPSGWEVFSGYAGDFKADESLPPCPKGIYGETKYLCELLLEQHQRNLGLEYVLLRSGPVYGAASKRPKFLLNYIEKAARNETITTHRYRNGFPCIDLLHIEDSTAALLAVLDSEYRGTLHIGSGRGISTADIARLVVQAMGASSQIAHREIDEFTAKIVMDCARAEALLGWQPQIPLEEGLLELISAAAAPQVLAEGNS